MNGEGDMYARFPPGHGKVSVPLGSRRVAMAGLSLYVASRRVAVLAQRAAWVMVALSGTRVLGRRLPWSPPMGGDVWRGLLREWRKAVGPFDDIAVYEPRQASRHRMAALLLQDGKAKAFVKADPAGRGLEIERRVLAAFEERPASSFRTPVTVGNGRCEDWGWLAMAALPCRHPHRAARSVRLGALVEEVQGGVASVLDPGDAPAGWRPMHGDLAPWNLRRVGRGLPWLLDWEESSWGPPGADATYFRATSALVTGGRPESRDLDAIRFWQTRLKERAFCASDRSLNLALIETLGAMYR